MLQMQKVKYNKNPYKLTFEDAINAVRYMLNPNNLFLEQEADHPT